MGYVATVPSILSPTIYHLLKAKICCWALAVTNYRRDERDIKGLNYDLGIPLRLLYKGSCLGL